jgi:hypothetical protein
MEPYSHPGVWSLTVTLVQCSACTEPVVRRAALLWAIITHSVTHIPRTHTALLRKDKHISPLLVEEHVCP